MDIDYLLELSMVSDISNKEKRDRLIEKVCKKYNKTVTSKTLEYIGKKHELGKTTSKYFKEIDKNI